MPSDPRDPRAQVFADLQAARKRAEEAARAVAAAQVALAAANADVRRLENELLEVL